MSRAARNPKNKLPGLTAPQGDELSNTKKTLINE